jgi:hypothetical protein
MDVQAVPPPLPILHVRAVWRGAVLCPHYLIGWGEMGCSHDGHWRFVTPPPRPPSKGVVSQSDTIENYYRFVTHPMGVSQSEVFMLLSNHRVTLRSNSNLPHSSTMTK